MKIQLNQTWEDGGIIFPRFAVLEMSDSEALALIAEGYGHRVPDDTRLFVSETLIDTCVATPAPPLGDEMIPTGEDIALEELISQKPQSVPKTAKFRL